MKFFWEEQQKYIKCFSRGIQYHDLIIKLCLWLEMKSTLQSLWKKLLLACFFFQADITIGFIKTKNSIRATRGVKKNNINKLENQTKN